MESKFYTGTKLLSLKDIDGCTPEIYICTSNRSAGKSVYFSRLCVNNYLKGKGKFMLIYRFNYELDDCAGKFFKDIGNIFFKGHTMESKRRASGLYHELFFDDKSCGYAIALNGADQIKKYAHFFSDVERMLFDEFQSETNHYCNDEVTKFISVHMSVARGNGEQSRYLPVYMVGNPISILNPYYITLGISTRLKKDTKFLRGKGFVLEQGFVESASKAQAESAFNKAFNRNNYVSYAQEAVYLNDNESFVERVSGNSKYLATLRYKGNDYAIREFAELGIIYCDDRPDATFKNKITVTTNDHQINYVMLKRNDFFLGMLRYYFERGCFRFKDLQCKEVVLNSLSY